MAPAGENHKRQDRVSAFLPSFCQYSGYLRKEAKKLPLARTACTQEAWVHLLVLPKQKGAGERDKWCAGSLSHKHVAGGMETFWLSPCADQVLPELSSSGGSCPTEGSGRTGLRVQVG